MQTNKKKEEFKRPDPLAGLGLTDNAADLVNDVKDVVTEKKKKSTPKKAAEPKSTKSSLSSELESCFDELYLSNKDNKSNGTTVWLTQENKEILDSIKYHSGGKYQLRPTVNTILNVYFKMCGIITE